MLEEEEEDAVLVALVTPFELVAFACDNEDDDDDEEEEDGDASDERGDTDEVLVLLL